jgi:signal transduction histidine kinase
VAKVRLRTKLVLSLILTTALLTVASLFFVHTYLRNHAKKEIQSDLANSLQTFEQYTMERRERLSQLAVVPANLSYMRSLIMGTDTATVEDFAEDFRQQTESDLFLLANREGKVVGLHSAAGDFTRRDANDSLAESLEQGRRFDWWFGGGRLYEVFLQPIYFGPPEDGIQVGVLAAGFAVNLELADRMKRLIFSDIAFRFGETVVTSSLQSRQQQELSASARIFEDTSSPAFKDIQLGGENFVAASVTLAPIGRQPVTLMVLKSYDAATLFLQNVNRRLIGVGVVALVAGAALMFLISDRLTRPLARLVSGVVALEKGDFSYPLQAPTHDEIGELTAAFDKMRNSLQESQQHLLHAERLATIGRMASTISHDLRHPLTTVLAYAELLSESNLDEADRRDMYGQIRLSVNNMAELISSLLEFSKAQEALRLAYGDCVDTLQDTIRAVKLRPEFSRIQLTLQHNGPTQGWFDFAKLDRAFNNLLRNACEAVSPDSGHVRVIATGSGNRVEVRVSDNGSGIPEEIRDDLFQPFVTFGKPDGTGLGLAVVQKIVRDHSGDVAVESTGPQGTTFRLTFPVVPDTMSNAS